MSPTIPLPPRRLRPTLLEPCFLDLITAIEQAKDLPKQTQRHWACSVRQITKWLDRPAAVDSGPLAGGADFLGATASRAARRRRPRTLANHRSNVRAALRWFGKEQGVPQQGARLSPEWARFMQQLESVNSAAALQFGSLLLGPSIGPTSVDDYAL